MPSDPWKKEPAFFCSTYGLSDPQEYEQIFSKVTQEKIIGEASHAYLTSPESPALIKASIPHARFVIVLRNPVDRAYSLYHWMTRAGEEYASTFESALDLEYFHNYMYYSSGLYSLQITRLTPIDASGIMTLGK